MALPHADQIIARAQAGEKISTADRRHATAYIMGAMSELSNREIGALFGVTERAVRIDKKIIRDEKSKIIAEDDIGLVIADIVMTYENQIRDLEKVKKACSKNINSTIYVNCCKLIFDMRMRMVEALQNLGYYPKNLGNMTVEKFSYKSIVNEKDGSVDTRPVNMFDVTPTPDRDLSIVDAEFSDIKQIEAANV